MKTYYFFIKKTLFKSIVGLLGLTAISCGSYQNKSYYDNDGIYGGEKEKTAVESTEQNPKTVEANNKYKDYFGSNANKYSNEQSEVLTDVENYSSVNDDAQNNNSTIESYSSWGSDTDHITINVYDNNWGGYYNSGYWNNYWGYSPWRSGIYVGWNSWDNGWYNPYWGYSGYYNWGWNNPYYTGYYGYNNYYGYNYGYYGNNYAYSHGRRGSVYTDRYGNNGGRNYSSDRRNGNRIDNPRTNTSQPRGTRDNTNYNTPRPRSAAPRSSDYSSPRSDANSGNNTNSTPRPRNNNTSPRSNDYNTPRPRSESPRTYESPRSESPRNYDSPRSSSSSGSSNGGSSSGGGRSSGGRRG